MDIQTIASWGTVIFWIIAAIRKFLRWEHGNIFISKRSFKDKLFIVFTVIAILFSAYSIYLVKSNPFADVFKPFAPIYEVYKKQLGEPQGQIVKNSSVYYAVHEQAIVIWFKPLAAFYVLDRRNPKWAKWNDPDWETDKKWNDDSWLREKFRPPKNMGPPYSGVAKFWNRDPKSWSWIGWRKWHCSYSEDVYYQEFEHGIIMGGFPLSPSPIHKEEAIIFILTDDAQWSSRQSTMLKPPICITPP